MSELYSKKELSKILALASEIQNQKDITKGEEGLSEEELLGIAREVGIDQETLLMAINRFKSHQHKSPFSWIKGTTSLQSGTTFEGELTEEQWEELLEELIQITGEMGESSSSRNKFELKQTMGEIGSRYISFSSKNGKTKFSYLSNWTAINLLSSVFSFVIGFAIALIALKESGLAKGLYMALSPFGGFLAVGLSRFFLKRFFNKEQDKLQKIIEAASSALEEGNKPQIFIEEDTLTDTVDSSVKSKIQN